MIGVVIAMVVLLGVVVVLLAFRRWGPKEQTPNMNLAVSGQEEAFLQLDETRTGMLS